MDRFGPSIECSECGQAMSAIDSRGNCCVCNKPIGKCCIDDIPKDFNGDAVCLSCRESVIYENVVR